MKSVLIIGGYGQFGSRLARRLAGQCSSGLQDPIKANIIIAGRTLQKAQALCDRYDGAFQAAAFDLDKDIAAQLSTIAPDIVVDAAGPYQAAFAKSYALPKACIALGIHYLDLSDSGEFTSGIAALDEAARAANTAIISGASSVPALSGAVIRDAALKFATLVSIEGGISPGGNHDIGVSVVKAVLSYLGKPLTIHKGGRAAQEIGFSRQHKKTIAAGSMKPMTRRFGLCDAPDAVLVPIAYPKLSTARFYGGTELGFTHNFLRVLGWLQQRGLIRNLHKLARLFAKTGSRLGKLASDRGGMYMEFKGQDKTGQHAALEWHLIAENGHGPFIPILAAEILIRRWLHVSPAPGGRSAHAEITLGEFETAFRSLSIACEFKPMSKARPLFQSVLGANYQDLPAALRYGHNVQSYKTLSGKVSVTRGKNPLCHIIAAPFGFPKSTNDAPVTVNMEVVKGREVWTRTIAGQVFRSTLSETGIPGDVYEQFGPFKFRMRLRPQNDRLYFDIISGRAFGIPLPRFLLPKSDTFEHAEGGIYCFDVDISVPLFGRLVHYKGTLPKMNGG